jgi:hypothetical protein
MTDRELLEMAAKAAGLAAHWSSALDDWQKDLTDPYVDGKKWNPLDDDGAALRLAVKLGLAVVPYPIYSKPKHSVIAKQYDHARYFRGKGQDVLIEEVEVYGDDPAAATRRAIVRAAAEIGKAQ